MKKFIFIFSLIITCFIFFSFLTKTVSKDEKSLLILYDNDLKDSYVVLGDIKAKFQDSGYKLCFDYFNPEKLNSYIISNPDAIYLTDKLLHSDLFSLKKIDYLGVKIAITNINNKIDNIKEEEFRKAIKDKLPDDSETIKKIIKKKIPYGIISYGNLNLDVKPLSVDGVFPGVQNIKNGKYKMTYNAYIYTKKDLNLLNKLELENDFDCSINKCFSIIAGGDIMLSRGIKKYMEQSGYNYPFINIKDMIKEYDIAFANLESPISNNGAMFNPNKGIYFKAEPSCAEGLRYSGFDVLSLANNHALDWGSEAINDTMNILSKSGIRFTGVGRTRDEAIKPTVFNLNGSSVAFIAYNDIYPFSIKEGKNSIQVLKLDETKLKEELSNLKQKYDILIVSVHTGREYIQYPEAKKISIMRKMIDYGADVVLGSHPHVVQGIEIYKNKLISYSLGNLIFDQNWSKETSFGLLLEINFLDKMITSFNPLIVYINNGQACIVNNDDSRNILSNIINFKWSSYELSKN